MQQTHSVIAVATSLRVKELRVFPYLCHNIMVT